ncbi:acetyl-CoA acetyltransferase [Nitratireductor aestuarii]|uniref:Acetyl-CoA acetyltransferase n=1 Tax=Nitratireductor aestuarii TaxID=1735103 RepID=A0A916W324_9HYPH|nr:acetyl-CoA C-acetyltransferase [Nitratireductor aestuarii]GGA63470.1 acetyl-CoA acetyltransferase [Nitratireductor aestuarii]
MPEAYIIDAVRTPVGRKKGSFATTHSADLGAIPIKALIERTGIDPSAVDDVVFGCVETLGPQAGDIARTCWLVAGMPLHVPGVTVDRQCGSSQQAIHFAAQGVMSGTQDLVVAGGVQNLNLIPISGAMIAGQQYGFPDPFSTSPGWQARFGTEEVNQFRSAQMIADKWEISREEMEQFAYASHARAIHAIDSGYFEREIVPVGDFRTDETPRRDTTLERMASLKPLLEGGTITAGVASQNSDAAAAMLIASERAVKEHNLKPRARIHHLTVRADDPVWMLTAPIPATRHALEKTGLKVEDIDLFECNEAFASVTMAWMKELGIPHEKVNVNGGAIALGHPLGATGARLMTTMLHELERRGGRYGLQTMCEGGGQANVTIIERL